MLNNALEYLQDLIDNGTEFPDAVLGSTKQLTKRSTTS